MRSWSSLLVVLATVAALSSAAAQTYPSRVVKIILPYPPGSASDTVSRMIATKLSPSLGQPVVVENIAGAAGGAGSQAAAKAPADGHTLLMADLGLLAMNPSVFASLPYDPAKDFTPVVDVASLPLLLAINPGLPASTTQEFVALAKQRPGQLFYGSPGPGSIGHLTSELFKIATGTNIVHVPYKGAPPALNDLLGGHISMMFGSMLFFAPQAQAGRIRVLGIAATERSKVLPEIPTLAEGGVPGFVAESWFGVMAPAGTPETVIARLNGEINRILHSPEFVKLLEEQGGRVVGGTPQQFGEHIRQETLKWASVVKTAGIPPN
jgi:tripartite-type tricarboxylate transporter receptor subunit TctC